MNKTESIKAFLTEFAPADLAARYHFGMEVQVNVAQDNGKKIAGTYEGKKWIGWSDGITEWKAFRIPYNANTEPEYTDHPLKFDIVEHCEGIGMTGWNWQDRVSEWVAFDFDSIVGHSDKHKNKLSDHVLEEIAEKVKGVKWVELRHSTGGQGLHIYVHLNKVPTANHNEHAALARAILGQLSSLIGFDLHSKVDICGGNMWVWHRKLRTNKDQEKSNGLQLIKKGVVYQDIPKNWQDHLDVVTHKTKKTRHGSERTEAKKFKILNSQKNVHELDEEHLRLIHYLEDSDFIWWWEADHSMLVTHTYALKQAHIDLKLQGLYDTDSEGKDLYEQNCFCFPKRNGAWIVRRYSVGCKEHVCWSQDESGWTYCNYNQRSDLKTAVKFYEGLEDDKGDFIFIDPTQAIKAAACLGINLPVPSHLDRAVTLHLRRSDGRLVIKIEKRSEDRAEQFKGYVEKKSLWVHVCDMIIANEFEEAIGNYDETVRHLVNSNQADGGWFIFSNSQWREEPLIHVKPFLQVLGFSQAEQKAIVGSCIHRPWVEVNKPFDDEYPGNREWNRNSTQLRFTPKENLDDLHYPTWQKILDHCGKGLDEGVQESKWCKENGVTTGAEYLTLWVASLFQFPEEPLPYLFFHGPQNSGKSIFHESIELLVTGSAVMNGGTAIQNQGGFNAEITRSILCYIEEIDLNGRQGKTAYNKIKEWVTARKILIHEKRETPYQITNTTHWVQMSNDANSVPVFPGDTRICVIYVEPLQDADRIPKKYLLDKLEQEAPDFLGQILNIELPETDDRLNIPVVESEEKSDIASINRSAVQEFIDETCYSAAGEAIQFSDLFDKFIDWMKKNKERNTWTKRQFSREMEKMNKFPKGRYGSGSQIHYGNISLTDPEKDNRVIKLENPTRLVVGGKNKDMLVKEII